MVNSFDSVLYTLNYVIPGYIILKIIEMIVPSPKKNETEIVVQAIGYSILNNSIWSFVFSLLEISFSKNIVLLELSQSIALILTGTVTGVCIAVIKKKNIIGWVLGLIKIDTTNPIPTAWDYIFSKHESYWLEVGVSNGKMIRGLFYGDSFASSENGEKDLYLEKLYEKKENGWEKVEQTKGVWINHNEIRYIKFYQSEGDDNDEK